MNCCDAEGALRSRTARIFVAEDGVVGRRVELTVGPLGVNESNERSGVAQFADHDRSRVGLQDDDAAPRKALGHPLIDAQRDYVAQVNRAALVVQHATFDDDSLVGDVHLVRTPAPRSREGHEAEGAGEDEPSTISCSCIKCTCFAPTTTKSDHNDGGQARRTVPRATGVTVMILTSPSRRIIRGAIAQA